MKSPLIAVALVVAVSTFASAQGAPPPAVRGVIERVAPDRGVIDVKTRGGGVMDVRLMYVGHRLYMLIAAFPSISVRRDQDVTRFFNSFKLVPSSKIPETMPAAPAPGER